MSTIIDEFKNGKKEINMTLKYECLLLQKNLMVIKREEMNIRKIAHHHHHISDFLSLPFHLTVVNEDV